MSREREWWLRVPAVLVRPRAVFVALRDQTEDDLDARQEPVLALIFLAGIGAVLDTRTAARLFDTPEFDGLLVALWALIFGGVYGMAGYFIIGGALYLAARGLGGLGDYRRARHVVAFAAVPLALSLFLLRPAELVAFGGDVFRSGGSDAATGGDVLQWLERALAAWALGLLVVGLRVVHAWSWPRSLAAFALAVALPLAAAVIAELA